MKRTPAKVPPGPPEHTEVISFGYPNEVERFQAASRVWNGKAKTRRRLRGFRRLVVDGALWLWRVSSYGTVTLRGPNGERRYLAAWDILGISAPDFERGQHKNTVCVMPGDVARAIRGEPPRDRQPQLDLSARDAARLEALWRTA